MKVKPLYWPSDQDYVLSTMRATVQVFVMHVNIYIFLIIVYN